MTIWLLLTLIFLIDAGHEIRRRCLSPLVVFLRRAGNAIVKPDHWQPERLLHYARHISLETQYVLLYYVHSLMAHCGL